MSEPVPAQSSLQEQIDEFLQGVLGAYKPKRACESKVIRDTVAGFVELYPHEVALLDTPLFQRLRYIQQTSLAYFTYPSTGHSRFEHSLGCLLMATKIIDAIGKKNGVLSDVEIYTIRLAALLHDVGHGPFSHASECFYENYPEIEEVKAADPELYKDAGAHEILGSMILDSPEFLDLWNKIVERCESKLKQTLENVNIEYLSKMILGKEVSADKAFMSQIVNGAFDVDKLDYLQRDGYFSGIQTILDIDRLLITVGVFNSEQGKRELYTDLSGVTVLEQVMFNKMILFSSMYHHHKVRAGLIALNFLLHRIHESKGEITIKNLFFDKAVDFLRIDDRDILNQIHTDARLNRIVSDIKNRLLLKRALVICPISLQQPKNPYFYKLQNSGEERESVRKQLSKDAENYYNVYLDCPKPPSFLGGPLSAHVKLAKNSYVNLNELYPVSGWVAGYAQYRYKGYVFAKPGMEKTVAKEALDLFKSKGMELNEKALTLAKNSLD